MPEVRRLPVPNGLTGMRVDAGLAKLLGMSRTTVATMIDAGDVLVDGSHAVRSA
ncbi:MAG: RNA pseudouridine synthase, partial [Nakamurella sp.]